MSNIILLAIIAPIGGGSTRYYATEQYATRNADTPANTLFEGRLVDAIYERAVAFPAWDRAGGSQPISYLELVNVDGALDDWLTEDWRDIRITLKIVVAQAAYSTATQVGVCVVDRIEAPSASTVRLVCRSVYERLEKTITTAYSDSVTNEVLRNQPKPITLGRVRWCDPANYTLNDSAGSARGLYDVADGYFESLLEVRARGSLLTEAQERLLISTPNYFVRQGDTWGFIRRSTTETRLACEVRGQIRRVSQIATNSDFPTASGGKPAGWTSVEGADGVITWDSAGAVIIESVGTSAVYIAQTQTLTTGAVYQLEVSISAASLTGVLSISIGSTMLRSLDATDGVHQVCFVADGITSDIRVGFLSGASGEVVLNHFKCWAVKRIATLAEVVTFAGVTRGSLADADLDSTALAAIDTAAGYAIGWHSSGDAVRGIDLVTLAAQSFGVAIFQSANGTLKPVRIAAPAGSADFTLNEFSILDITYEADTAPGLSARMQYGRNYAPHSVDDCGDLPASTTAAISLLKAELQREVSVVTTTESLHAVYAEAQERDPLPSLLSEEANAQTEIDRLCALYTTPRAFYTLRAFVDSGTTHTIEPGDTVAVTHSRYGLSSGVNLLVVAARSDFLGNAIDLVLWG